MITLMKKILAVAYLVIIALGSFPLNVDAKSCELSITLTENGQPVLAQSVKIADYKKFGLRVSVEPCFIESYVRYRFKVDNGTESELHPDDMVQLGGGVRDISFGKPTESKIVYTAIWSSNNLPEQRFGTYDNTAVKKEITINWSKGDVRPPTGNPSGGGESGGTTTQNPQDQGPKGKDNKDINSGVTAKLEFGLDTELGKFFNPLDDQLTVPGLIVRLINIVLVFSGMISVAFIIYGGLIMVSSAGNESRVTKGKNTLIYAVAGLIVSILSFSIVALIQGVISRV